MNSTVKYLLVGGAVVGGVIFVSRAMAPPVVNNSGTQSLLSGLGSIATGFGSWIKGKTTQSADQTNNDSANAETGGSGLYGATVTARRLETYDSGGGVSSPSAWSSMGDASISDGGGYSRLSGKNQQPSGYLRPADRAQLGIFTS